MPEGVGHVLATALGSLAPATLGARVDAPDLHRLDAALARGRRCILVLPHLGNWDVVGLFLAINGYRSAAVAENLRPARLAALFRRHREELGIRIVPLVHPKVVYDEIERLLVDNWVVALVAVQGEPRVTAFIAQLIARGKKPLQADVAVMRKLLHAIYGMFATNTDFVAEKFYSVVSETA